MFKVTEEPWWKHVFVLSQSIGRRSSKAKSGCGLPCRGRVEGPPAARCPVTPDPHSPQILEPQWSFPLGRRVAPRVPRGQASWRCSLHPQPYPLCSHAPGRRFSPCSLDPLPSLCYTTVDTVGKPQIVDHSATTGRATAKVALVPRVTVSKVEVTGPVGRAGRANNSKNVGGA